MSASNSGARLEEKHLPVEQSGRRIPGEIKQQILYAIANIEYGSVEVMIHDGKIMQIECREKIRMNQGSGTGNNGRKFCRRHG